MSGEVYLGDGLYASYDGWGYKLRAPRGHDDHWVYLDDTVLAEFDRFRKEIEQRSQERADALRKAEQDERP